MPYSISLARQQFSVELALMLSTCKSASLKRSGFSNYAKEMLYQAAIFKASAFLEEYLKGVIDDWIFLIISNNYKCQNLPENMKWFFVTNSLESGYKSYFYQPNELILINSSKRNPHFSLLSSGDIPKKLLNTDKITNKKYPSVKNIRSLFIRIGIENIFSLIDRKLRTNSSLQLESFLSIREAIAHQAPPSLTYNDIKKYLDDLKVFVGVIDRVLYSHVLRYTGNNCWKKSIT
jgi:hypothetical protein